MNFKQLLLFPETHSGAFKVWSRNFLYFKKTWLVAFFWTILEPVVYLGAIGFGLGAFVSNMNGSSYVEFFFPALLCSTAMMVSFFESTYGAYTKLTHQRTYATIMLTRIGPNEIILGELLWGASKGFFGAVGVALVASVFGLIDSYRILLALPILFLTSWMFSCLGMIMTSVAKNYDSFIYSTSGLIVPMSLLSGTYFPLEQLPSGLRYLSYLFPLTHSVASVRDVISGNFSWLILANLAFIITVSWLMMNISVYRISQKLLK